MAAADARVLEHLPFFAAPPRQPDFRFNAIVVVQTSMVFVMGNFCLHLHSVPERMARKADGAQLQLISILMLTALLTHNDIYRVPARARGDQPAGFHAPDHVDRPFLR